MRPGLSTSLTTEDFSMCPFYFSPCFRLAVACLSLAVLSACSDSHSQAGAPAEPPQPVVVVTLKSQPVSLTRELPGRTQAFLSAEVRPQVGGIVRQMRFVEGGEVKAGQALYELDDAIHRAGRESAQAQLNKAQAGLHLAQVMAARSRELFRQGMVPAQDNEKLIAAETQAKADVGVAEAALAASKVSLDHAHISAPISGRIGKSYVTRGALVTADQTTPLSTISQLDPIYIEINQSSSNWLELKQAIAAGRVQTDAAGARVKIVLENGKTYAHEGKLQFAEVTVDPGTGNFLLRALVPNPELLLLPGMFVRAVVTEGALVKGILVPQPAIAREPNGSASALVVGKDGKVASRVVHVARTVGDQWLVESGLEAGERVIVEGLQKVRPGSQVVAQEQAAAKPGAGEAKPALK
jgi:membrane fusion protein (multidrug efflux system)